MEVKIKELNSEDQKLFTQAKDKELDSWLATDTVKRILRDKIPEGSVAAITMGFIMESTRPQEQKETGVSRKAKA